MKIALGLVATLFLASCAKPAPPAASVVRSVPADVLFTLEVYDVPSAADDLVSNSLTVLTAAAALNLRDRLDVVNAKLRSNPRIATLFGKPATVSQGGQDTPGFAFRADASVEGDRLATRFSWLDLAPGDRPPTSTSMEGATSWTTTVDRSSVVSLRLPDTADGTSRLALVRVEVAPSQLDSAHP